MGKKTYIVSGKLPKKKKKKTLVDTITRKIKIQKKEALTGAEDKEDRIYL